MCLVSGGKEPYPGQKRFLFSTDILQKGLFSKNTPWKHLVQRHASFQLTLDPFTVFVRSQRGSRRRCISYMIQESSWYYCFPELSSTARSICDLD